jgi:hypothetical protein
MPYEPVQPPRPASDDAPGASEARSNPPAARFSAIAALFFLSLALFNLFMTLPLGVPPEFPLFLLLSAIAAGVWWVARPRQGTRRPSSDR